MVGKSKKTILVVDDEIAIFHIVEMILDAYYKGQCDLLYSRNIPEAQQYIESEAEIDLILLDIMIPGECGLKLLEILKNKGIRIPVIIISAVDTARAATEALQKGAIDYITKPFVAEEIRTKILNVLS